MPDPTTTERLATLEAQVQGLADLVYEVLYGTHPAYRIKWTLIADEPEPQWIRLYDWKLDPSHPLHAKAAGDG